MAAMDVDLDRDRFVATIQEQAEIGGTDDGGLHRLALSDTDAAVRDWFAARLDDAGLDVTIDEFGNMFGYREGRRPDAGTVLLGSHLDSQPNGGIYDGAMGVVAALELVRTLNDAETETDHPIEVVNWTNEEGSRYQPGMQGSGVWAGTHDIETEFAKTDTEGAVLEDELERIGYKGAVPATPQREYDSYLELHIEQGPYLEADDVTVGAVTGIVGFTWGAITMHGEADHSGPTPMHHRADALVAAADVITAIRRIPNSLGRRTVGTTGYIDAKPNSINVIPEEVTFTWGFRDTDPAVIEAARERVLDEAELAADREGVDVEYEDRMWADPVQFDDDCIGAVDDAADRLGYDSTRLFSGAGHDATHMADLMDTGMVFARSENGTSHNESEFTSWDDCYRAANTFANAALDIATA
jgi:N-carbamoyl-L-amino-acid hydrolase